MWTLREMPDDASLSLPKIKDAWGPIAKQTPCTTHVEDSLDLERPFPDCLLRNARQQRLGSDAAGIPGHNPDHEGPSEQRFDESGSGLGAMRPTTHGRPRTPPKTGQSRHSEKLNARIASTSSSQYSGRVSQGLGRMSSVKKT